MKTSIALLSGCLAAQSAYADIQSQDPRALGMGGAGTAIANSAQAQFYNPSLLISAKENEDFNFEIFATGRLADPDNLKDSAIDFTDKKYILTFTNLIVDFNNKLTEIETDPSKIADLGPIIDNLTSAAQGLQNGIQDLSGKSLSANGNGGFMTSVPNGKIGWAVYFNAWTDIGAKFNLGGSDNQILTDFIDIPNQILADFQGSSPTNPADLISPIDNLDSTITLDAVFVKEFGVSLAHPYTLSNYTFDVGITPKYMAIQTFGIEQSLQQAEGESAEIDFNDAKNYSSFNVDIGLSKQLNEYWKSGIVIKNLIPQSFKTQSTSGNKIEIKPAVRVGTSYRYRWATVAADFDLTKNIAPASGIESRYLSLGAELDLWLAKLRLGYRANLAASNNNTTSAGLGLYLFGLNIDAAVAVGNSQSGVNEANGALQIGLQW